MKANVSIIMTKHTTLLAGQKYPSWLGIDYGSKLAGTTAICWQEHERLHLAQSALKQDADAWVAGQVSHLGVSAVYIDAPLSLPSAYQPALGQMDFMYREADRELKAMSPMFLGGLTARAMGLAHGLQQQAVNCHEVYPARLMDELLPTKPWKKKDKVSPEQMERVTTQLLQTTGFRLHSPPASTHQVDALLAWLSGYRHQQGQHKAVGNAQEGLIII